MESNFESCDKCLKVLDLSKNEDIWLEPIDMVLCSSCHSEHTGIEKYWSYNTVKEYYRNQKVAEWCSYCTAEVELKREFVAQICPNCGEKILPCAQCETQNCSDCPLEVA